MKITGWTPEGHELELHVHPDGEGATGFENYYVEFFDSKWEECYGNDPFACYARVEYFGELVDTGELEEVVLLDLRRRPEDVKVKVPKRLPKGSWFNPPAE